MTAGLPGIGIGGIFYLACAFLMPFVALAKTLAGSGNRRMWIAAGVQFYHASGIIAGFWLTGKFLASCLNTAARQGVISTPVGAENLFRIKPLFISLGVLLGVFATLQISNFFFNRALKKQKRRNSQKNILPHLTPARELQPALAQKQFYLPLTTQS